MTNRLISNILMVIALLTCSTQGESKGKKTFQVLIVGGGASGVMAGIQSARMGIETLIIEPTEWLGGMLTIAGVSAIDGNHKLPSGLWGEFRQKLYDHYGGPEAVETGWVSNTLFEPSVGNKIFKELAENEPHLTIWYKAEVTQFQANGNLWNAEIKHNNKTKRVASVVVIDATELGDVLAQLGAPYAIGMDSKASSGEEFAPDQENDIIQDLTYVVTLKDYGKGQDRTIPKPSGYNPDEFACACNVADPISEEKTKIDCNVMMTYGQLPNNKYMINWPSCGNDIYLNFIEASEEERARQIEQAKLHSLRFIYYLQTEMGLSHLGIAEGEYPTADHLPLIPYYRESRRVKGLVTLSLNHVRDPYQQADPYYKTGIAVGDYPIDHHHKKNPKAPKIDFLKIRVPSYNVPMGSLIPQKINGLIVAEKSISVTNIVNGATRLQPVVLQIGQAAGALAALSVKQGIQPRAMDVRKLQTALLQSGAYLMPFIDVSRDDPHFEIIQKIGSTGILQGKGVPYKWANQTWFYPELPISEYEFLSGLKRVYPQYSTDWNATGQLLTLSRFIDLTSKMGKTTLHKDMLKKDWEQLDLKEAYEEDLVLDRRTVAVLLNHYYDPFSIAIDVTGHVEHN